MTSNLGNDVLGIPLGGQPQQPIGPETRVKREDLFNGAPEKTEKKTAKIAVDHFDSDDILDDQKHCPKTRQIHRFEGDGEKPPKNPSKPQGTPNKHPNGGNLKDAMDKFKKDLQVFEELYKSWEDHFGDLGAGLKIGLNVGDYSDRNEDNARVALPHILPSSNVSDAEEKIKAANKCYKWVNHTVPLALNIYKLGINFLLYKKFADRLEDFKTLCKDSLQLSLSSSTPDPDIALLQMRMDTWNKRLNLHHSELKDDVKNQSNKLVQKLLNFPIEYQWNWFDHTHANGVTKAALMGWRSFKRMCTIKLALDIQKEWGFHLQPTIYIHVAEEEQKQTPKENGALPARTIKPKSYSIHQGAELLRDLRNCSTLQEIQQIVKYPNYPSNIRDALDALGLEDCTSLSEAQAKLHTGLMIDEVTAFIRTLEKCPSIHEVQRFLTSKGITTVDLPSTFERWQALLKDNRFITHLKQTFYCAMGRRPFMDKRDIDDLLTKREAQRRANIEEAADTIILDAIQECNSKNFSKIEEIEAFFKSYHITIKDIQFDDYLKGSLPVPPKCKDTWLTCIASPEFRRALAAPWVDYQETTAQLLDQGLRQALLSKLKVETAFLNFRWTENLVGIFSALMQGIYYWPKMTLQAFFSLLELFVKEFSKLNVPGIGIAYLLCPLYPNFDFKLENIIIYITEHFFAIKYKPNEYSVEGYRLNLQIRLINLELMANALFFMLKQAQLWLTIRLIDNCIMGIAKKPLEQEIQYIQLNERYKDAHAKCKTDIKKFEELLSALKLKDANLAIVPNAKSLAANNLKYDAIPNVIESLKDANFDYFPPHILKSFQDNFGYQLTNENKPRLKKILEDFFKQSEVLFAKQYQMNRYAYLRAESAG